MGDGNAFTATPLRGSGNGDAGSRSRTTRVFVGILKYIHRWIGLLNE